MFNLAGQLASRYFLTGTQYFVEMPVILGQCCILLIGIKAIAQEVQLVALHRSAKIISPACRSRRNEFLSLVVGLTQ